MAVLVIIMAARISGIVGTVIKRVVGMAVIGGVIVVTIESGGAIALGIKSEVAVVMAIGGVTMAAFEGVIVVAAIESRKAVALRIKDKVAVVDAICVTHVLMTIRNVPILPIGPIFSRVTASVPLATTF